MFKYFALVSCMVLFTGCISTGIGASFNPQGGVSGHASFCIDSKSPSYMKTRDAMNRFANLGNVFDTASALIHCNLPPAAAMTNPEIP